MIQYDSMEHLPFPDFHSTRVLAGEIPQSIINVATEEQVKADLEPVFETGKNVKLNSTFSLPWEADTEGKKHSTPSDVRKFQIQWLKKTVGLKQDSEIFECDDLSGAQGEDAPLAKVADVQLKKYLTN